MIALGGGGTHAREISSHDTSVCYCAQERRIISNHLDSVPIPNLPAGIGRLVQLMRVLLLWEALTQEALGGASSPVPGWEASTQETWSPLRVMRTYPKMLAWHTPCAYHHCN
jgi:hypothetical protein